MNPLASTNIRWIEAEYLRYKEYKARKKPTNNIPVIDVEALKSGTVKLGIEVGIYSSFPSLHPSSASTPSIEAEATDEQAPLTKATILAFCWLAKVADLQDSKVESPVPKLVELAIAMTLRIYVDAEAK